MTVGFTRNGASPWPCFLQILGIRVCKATKSIHSPKGTALRYSSLTWKIETRRRSECIGCTGLAKAKSRLSGLNHILKMQKKQAMQKSSFLAWARCRANKENHKYKEMRIHVELTGECMDYKVWKESSVAELFANTIRGSIPMAAEQISVMQHVANSLAPGFSNVLDLGCGDGILGHAMLNIRPEAIGTFVDISEPLLELAMKRMAETGLKAEFGLVDYGELGWRDRLPSIKQFDLVVSGFSIHHQPDERKRELYSEIFAMLNPGGLFLNLEHLLPGSDALTSLLDELFIDGRLSHERRAGGARSREAIKKEYDQRRDSEANILAPLELQCQWLREIGYLNVDCYFKIFELGLFGGQKPNA